jgi:hypothetical protein
MRHFVFFTAPDVRTANKMIEEFTAGKQGKRK